MVMSNAANPPKRTLKSQYIWKIWAILVANALLLYTAIQANAISADGFGEALRDPLKMAPVGLAIVIATVANNLLSAESKARVVFLRWKHALPGHRAFSKYGPESPLLSLEKLEQAFGSPLPTDPTRQNTMWVDALRAVENEPLILDSHLEFLLTRDYAALSVLFIVLFGAAGFYAIPSKQIATIYFLILIAQYVLTRQAAYNCGVSFVTNVLSKAVTAKLAKPCNGCCVSK